MSNMPVSARNSDIIPYIKSLIRLGVKTVLDLGCGQLYDGNTGEEDILISCFDSSDYEVLGIDLCPGCVSWRKANMKNGEYMVLDVREIRKLEPRDLVLAHHVIEHLSKGDGYRLIFDMILKAKKQIIVGAPIGYTNTEYAVKLHNNEFERHISGWFPYEFRQLGFNVIEVKNVFVAEKHW